LSPKTRPLGTDDSGRFVIANGAGDSGAHGEATSSPNASLRSHQFSSSDGTTSVLTVHDAKPAVLTPKRRLGLAVAATALTLLSVVLLIVWQASRGETPRAAAAAPTLALSPHDVPPVAEPASPSAVAAVASAEAPKVTEPKRRSVTAARKPAATKPAAPTRRSAPKRRTTTADLGF
jgi:hypothetical protein